MKCPRCAHEFADSLATQEILETVRSIERITALTKRKVDYVSDQQAELNDQVAVLVAANDTMGQALAGIQGDITNLLNEIQALKDQIAAGATSIDLTGLENAAAALQTTAASATSLDEQNPPVEPAPEPGPDEPPAEPAPGDGG